VRALVQTVSRASVTVDGAIVGAIEDGLLVLVGVTHTDTATVAEILARKVYELRIFPAASDDASTASRSSDGAEQATRDERSAAEIGAPVLVVSQFTLYGDTRKGRRPSWSAAARAETAEPLVTAFAQALRSRGAKVETGQFRAHMLVESVNVGPRTLLLEI
jgi:D-tyrosyl-tRNA(Tyr) deacylase